MNTPLRTLPIRLELIEGETVDGFTKRLAQAHQCEERDIRRIVLDHLGRNWWPVADHSVVDLIEHLADLPRGALRPNFETDGMWVRCGHRSWRPEKCSRCTRFAEPRTACLECSGGLATTTIARGGALCLTHHHWAYRAMHADVVGLADYENAELLLRSQLWKRGVALHTGELNLAAAFVRAWHEGSESPSVIDDRMARIGIPHLDTYENALLCAYPEIIRLARVLTNPRTITPILDVTTSALTQADRLLPAVAKAIGEEPNDALRTFTISAVGCAHRAMLYMYGLRSSKQVKHQRCPLNRALIAAAHRQRACLLRHANPRLLPDIAGKTGQAAPRSRVIRNWGFEPDPLALSRAGVLATAFRRPADAV
ncbi:hypothetical protein E5344_14265 [Microbacterium laevaniformans]|uniref:TniQ protein n=1 Tax=Microbacterium laevaniformans TaxID=36807 RepID=A0A4S2CXZ7_9MICO|nr:hypothetical protein [Microbacterium laevaniformans]TGY33476.1 hypothetical protein E5344_14265 [Microbacterium laevaniformans]